jgi:hypothetical protein
MMMTHMRCTILYGVMYWAGATEYALLHSFALAVALVLVAARASIHLRAVATQKLDPLGLEQRTNTQRFLHFCKPAC